MFILVRKGIMKKLLITSSLIVAMASPALANKTEVSQARINDHYKTVLEQTPYKVEVCRDVKVPLNQKDDTEFDKESAIIGGIIGGVIGNQFGKGSGKEAMTGIGALSGAIIGGTKNNQTQNHKPSYTWERQCSIETRYQEEKKRVYSHSTITFWYEGKEIELKFQK